VLADLDRLKVSDEWFFELRHRVILQALRNQRDDGKPIDLITLSQRLKDYGNLDGVGGYQYLSSLPDASPSAANLEYYVTILREKFVARAYIGFSQRAQDSVRANPGTLDNWLRRTYDEFDRLAQVQTVGSAGSAEMYLPPGEFGDEHWQRWFGKTQGVPGLPLPALAFGDFPFLIREAEMTLIFGETKVGKSTLVSYIALHLLSHGWKVVYDSREVHRVETLKKLCNQLLGVSQLALTPENERLLQRAITWLHPRLLINRTTGIKHWRDILEAWQELATQGYKLFVLDNLMRIGIEEDDFNQQAAAAAAFANFCIETSSHMFLINHTNKANEGDFRKRSGGSAKVMNNVHNVCSVTRNEKKWEKLWPWLDLLKAGTITREEYEAEDDVKKYRGQFDAKFYVHAQRLDGARQNAARELWFKFGVGQYFDQRHPMPAEAVNWLDQWAKKPVVQSMADEVAADWPKDASMSLNT
jgi:energy-coupling factor transporter ATP-binding protein EcfA2